jgi:[ribosomal protein S5]-alanine N-acetyltransferase
MDIDCGVCRLRPWRAGDEDSLVRHASNRAVWLNLRDRFPHPYTRTDAEAWVQLAAARSPVTSFAIDLHGEAVGGVSLMLHDDIERLSVEIGYWLGEELWGRGIMTAAVRAATDYAFSAFELTRVFAVPFLRNPASVRVLENAGYIREGVMRRSAIKDGVVLDQALYAVTDLDRAARA